MGFNLNLLSNADHKEDLMILNLLREFFIFYFQV